RIRISVVATGIDAAAMAQPRPVISLVSDRSRPESVVPPVSAPTPQPAAAAMGPIAAAAAVMAATPQPVVAGTSALAVAQAPAQPQVAPAQPLPHAQPVVARPVPQPTVAASPAPVAAAPTPEAGRIERALVRDDSFIPPKPIEPQVRPATATAPV